MGFIHCFSFCLIFQSAAPFVNVIYVKRLSECSFTPPSRVVLTTDDDVDQGDGLHEWKIIYVAFSTPNSLQVSLWRHQIDSPHQGLLTHSETNGHF